jgi:hypothetical protein
LTSIKPDKPSWMPIDLPAFTMSVKKRRTGF